MNQTEVPKYAYNPEGQAISIRKSQENGDLYSFRTSIKMVSERSEWELRWLEIDWGMIFLIDSNCDEELFYSLKGKNKLVTIVQSDIPLEDGRLPIAAVLHQDKILYSSPGFNIQSYKKQPRMTNKQFEQRKRTSTSPSES